MPHELDLCDQSAELLPAREALGLVNLSNVGAVNTAVAVNIGGGETSATADQAIDSAQG